MINERGDWCYIIRFQKPVPPRIDVINPSLQVNNPGAVRPRGRLSPELRRDMEIEASTNGVPSQFEMVEMETADMVDPAIQSTGKSFSNSVTMWTGQMKTSSRSQGTRERRGLGRWKDHRGGRSQGNRRGRGDGEENTERDTERDTQEERRRKSHGERSVRRWW